MTDRDLDNMIHTMISLTIQEMSMSNMIDFISDQLEKEFSGWSRKSVVEHFEICWPEHFKNFTFEQQT